MYLVLEIKQFNSQKEKFGLKTWFEGHVYLTEERELIVKSDFAGIKVHKNYGILKSQDNCVKVIKKKNISSTRPSQMFDSIEKVKQCFKSKLESYLLPSNDVTEIYIIEPLKILKHEIYLDYPKLNAKE